jgi:hypothetical protein
MSFLMLGVPLPDPIVGFEGHHVAMDTEAVIVKTTDWASAVGRQISATDR